MRSYFMKRIRLIVVILALFCRPISSRAGSAIAASVRNCTWCHGTGAQGYTVAPRLAGQRALYIEAQLRGYAAHIRDNPLSKQYMWGAAANLDPTRYAIWRIISHRCRRNPPMTAIGRSRSGDKRFTSREFRKPISWPALPAMARLARACEKFRVSEECPISISSAGSQEWGQGYHSAPASPMPLVASTLGARRNRGARFLPQLRQIDPGQGSPGGQRIRLAPPQPVIGPDLIWIKNPTSKSALLGTRWPLCSLTGRVCSQLRNTVRAERARTWTTMSFSTGP